MRGQGKKLRRAAQLMARGQLRIGRGSDDELEPEDEVTAALAAFGLQAEEPLELDETFALWPECLATFNLFSVVQTQWHTGSMGNVTGLNYPGIEVVMRMRRIPKKEWPDLFAGLQVMEQASLEEWAART